MFEAITGLIIVTLAGLMFSLAVREISDKKSSDN
jgi:hypothetical protein